MLNTAYGVQESICLCVYACVGVIEYMCVYMHVCMQGREAVGESLTDSDLTHQLDASIVRMLKRVSSMKHQELFVAVGEALRRPLDASVFKKRIESLIDRDYIARDAADGQAYKYAA